MPKKILLLSILPRIMGCIELQVPGLGLACLKAYVLQHDDLRGRIDIALKAYPVTCLDKAVSETVEAAPAVIGLSCFVWNEQYIEGFINLIRKRIPDTRFILGGPSAWLNASKWLAMDLPVDFIVHGEGEKPFAAIVRHFLYGRPAKSQIPAVVYRQGDRVIHNDTADGAVEQLDEIPSLYTSGLVAEYEKLPVVMFESSRGCVNKCAYCLWSPWAKRIKAYSMRRVTSDLGSLMARRVDFITFLDALVNFNHQRTSQLFSFILKHNISTRFGFEIIAERLDDQAIELLNQMAGKSMLHRLDIGLQSIHAKTLKQVKRPANLERFSRNIVRFCPELKKVTTIDLISGLPGDNYRLFKQSIDYVYDILGIQRIQCRKLEVLTGTELHRDAARFNIHHDPHPPYYIRSCSTWSQKDMQEASTLGETINLMGFTCLNDAIFQLRWDSGVKLTQIAEELNAWMGRCPPSAGNKHAISYFKDFFTWFCSRHHKPDLLPVAVKRLVNADAEKNNQHDWFCALIKKYQLANAAPALPIRRR
jgi:radical SAM superfamily enzyme YgiQ (UPF0313 family)